MNTNRVRFWVWIHGSWVRLTLEPGQCLEHHYQQTTDEGWVALSHSWIYDGELLRVVVCCDGRDCDGRLTTYRSLYADPESIGQRPSWHPAPRWIEESMTVEDETAQAMNY